MSDRPPRYGEDTWYGVIGYEGDPHILAYRREHPDHITVPLRWKVPPSRDDDRQPEARRPARPGERAERARPLTLPRPGEMLSVAELKAIMAQARGEVATSGAADDLLIPVQSGRGPRGGRPAGPAGARRDWTGLEQWNQLRIDHARRRLAEIEPRNPMLQTLETADTPPTVAMADAMVAELQAARGRVSRGEPGRAGYSPADSHFGAQTEHGLGLTSVPGRGRSQLTNPDILPTLTSHEMTIVVEQVLAGRNVTIVPRSDVRTPDILIDGRRTEIKTTLNPAGFDPSSLSKALLNQITSARRQAPNVIVDSRAIPEITMSVAKQGIDRAVGADRLSLGGPKLQSIEVITNGGVASWRRE